MDENPYQSPLTEPPPSSSWRRYASFCVKLLLVPVALLAFYFGAVAVGSVLIITFPRYQDWILGPALVGGVAAGAAAALYCFRIANAIYPNTVQNLNSN